MPTEPVRLINVDKLADLVGGRFALTTLVAKRLRAINAGAPLLVDSRPGEPILETVRREIEEGRIWLEKATGVLETAEEDDTAALLDME